MRSLALLGASGCGKSVTLKCIAGILTPDEGHIVLDGVTLYDSAAPESTCRPSGGRSGYLFQQYALFPNMTVRQNIAAAVRDKARRADRGGGEARGRFRLEARGRPEARAALRRAAAAVRPGPHPGVGAHGHPAGRALLRPGQLPEIPAGAGAGRDTAGGFPGTVLWVSHDRGEVFRNCRRVCVIDRGRSQPVTTLGELFRSPGTEAAARLSGCKNYADARPREDAVFLPDWGLTLSCSRPVPEGVCRIGIRAHHVQLAGPGAENAFSCTAVKVVEDVFSTIVLLRPEGAAPEAPLLRMELDKDNWQAVPDKDRLTVSVPPEAILLLES